jgi:uncharacterized protein YecE (DUF72 family)
VRIGISGWRYAPWRGVFYPSTLPQREELRFASRIFPSIELNGSFYSLQRPEYFRAWHDETPADFVFAVKGPRFITHMKKLRDVETPLANFFASGLFALRDKLGPVLWQLPPLFRFRDSVLADFFELLPHDWSSAAKLARRHDARLTGRSLLRIDANRPIRHAIEIRHSSFACPEFVSLLKKHGIALVVAETAQRWPLLGDVTSDFVYVRLHGDKELYRSGYSKRALAKWAERIDAWRRGETRTDLPQLAPTQRLARKKRDVYCYFDNTDEKLRAPKDAQALARILGL